MKKNRHISKKQKDDSSVTEAVVSHPMDKDCFVFVNYASFMIICTLLTVAFLILLAAKTGAGYIGRPPVQNDYYSFITFIALIVLALLIKYNKKSVYGIIACTIIMEGLILSRPGSYSYYRYPSEQCKAITDYIIEQYVAADKSNKKAIVHVPVFPSEDNSPIAVTYGNGRIAMTLANYGITHGFIDSELVPDQEINERFGF